MKKIECRNHEKRANLDIGKEDEHTRPRQVLQSRNLRKNPVAVVSDARKIGSTNRGAGRGSRKKTTTLSKIYVANVRSGNEERN